MSIIDTIRKKIGEKFSIFEYENIEDTEDVKNINRQKSTDRNYFKDADQEFQAEIKTSIPGECYPGNAESPEDNAKILKSSHIAYGLGAIALFCTCLVAVNSFSSPKPSERTDSPDLSLSSKVNNPAAGLPDSYKDIAKYNDRLKKSSNPTVTQNSTIKESSEIKPLPKANPQLPSVIYSPPVAPVVPNNTALNKEENLRREREKALASPISFNLANGNVANRDNNFANVHNPDNNTGTYSENSIAGAESNSSAKADLYYGNRIFKISAGTVIPATMLTGATSDAPGSDVVAVVRQDIFDTYSGRHILIPQGTKIVGKSGAAGLRGNKRLTIVFYRLLFPNGFSIQLPDFQSIDGPGLPGLKDKYDQHSSTLLRTAFLASVFAAGAQSATGHTNGTDSRSPGEEAVAGSVASILNTAQSIVNRDANLNPTITINPGLQFSVFINKDLALGPYQHE